MFRFYVLHAAQSSSSKQNQSNAKQSERRRLGCLLKSDVPHKIRARVSNEGCDTGCWIELGDSGIKLSDAGATYVAATICRPNHARGANAQ